MKIYDISQEIFSCKVFPGDPAPKKTVLNLMEKGDLYNLTEFSMCAHNGTHIDAPFHFLGDGKTVDRLDLDTFVGDCYVARHAGDVTAADAAAILKKAQSAQRILIAGNVTVTIPPDWERAKLDINGDWGDHIALSHGENHFIIGYYPNFAVCGTGLDQQTVTIADMEARVGTYDDKSMWDFIVFPGDWVALNESGEDWTEEEKSEIISILESMTIDKEG